MTPPAKETVIIVHGTWAGPDPNPLNRRWYEPVDSRLGGEPFPTKLDDALKARGSAARCWAHCAPGDPIFQWWPGENSWIARTQAATALASYVTKLRKDGWRCHIVAHSHGGTVLAEALPQMGFPDESRSRLVTLGTPFMDTSSPVLDEAKWRRKNATAGLLILLAFTYYFFLQIASGPTSSRLRVVIAICWGLFVFGYFLFRRWPSLRVEAMRYRERWRYWLSEFLCWTVISVIIGFLLRGLGLIVASVDRLLSCQSCTGDADLLTNMLSFMAFLFLLYIADRLHRKLSRFILAQSPQRTDATIPVQPSLLAVSSRMDEPWQILHHLSTIQNPLAVNSSLLSYIFSSARSVFAQYAAVARVLGAKSYRDIGLAEKLATAGMQLLTIGTVIYALQQYYEGLRSSFISFHWLAVNLMIATTLVPLLVFAISGFAILLGDAFLSVYLSPLRLWLTFFSTLLSIPRTVMTYFVRRKSWSVLLEMALGLEGYRFAVPTVDQLPGSIAREYVRFENIPNDAEQRALDKRGAWVARHLGDVSQTFSNLTITAAEIDSLLRTVEQDQTLVHAAYYTDDECIARIADWISEKA
jgi:hypothetical protein